MCSHNINTQVSVYLTVYDAFCSGRYLADMKHMFSLISVSWFLKISIIFCHLSDPRCFWRIKDTKNDLGDKETYCFFSIYTKHGYVKNDYFGWNLDKQ
jgi:hypothetical protein